MFETITRWSQWLATQAHLRSLRDSFIITIPLLVMKYMKRYKKQFKHR